MHRSLLLSSCAFIGSALAQDPVWKRDDHSILHPVSHHVVDRSHLEHLTPALESRLHYMQKRSLGSSSAGSMAAQLHTQFQYPAVVLDHSKHIDAAKCDSSFTQLNITIGTPDAFAHAEENWNNYDKLLFLSADPSCHAEFPGQYGYFLAEELHFDTSGDSVIAWGSQIPITSALGDMQLNWGQAEYPSQSSLDKRGIHGAPTTTKTITKTSTKKTSSTTSTKTSSSTISITVSSSTITGTPSTTKNSTTFSTVTTSSSNSSPTAAATTCGAPPSATINGLPAAACGTGFDAALDAAMGYLNFDADGASNATEADAQLAAFIPNTGLTYAEFMSYTNGTYKARRDLIKRSFGSWLKKAVKTVVKAVVAPVVAAVAKVAVAVVTAVAAVAVAVVKDVVDIALTGYTESISLTIPVNLGPPSWMLESSPWGQAYLIWTYDESGSSVNYGIDADSLEQLTGADQIIPTVGISADPTPSIQLYCVDCGITGHLSTGGSATFSLLEGVTDLSINFGGSLQAAVNFGIDAYATYEDTVADFCIFSAGVPGLSIPDIFTVGPILSLNVDATVEVTALGQVLTGVSYEWPKFEATLDILHPSRSTSSGFAPLVAHNFQASGSLDVLASIGLPVSVGVGFELLNKWSWEAAIVDRPALGANASYQANYQSQETSSGSSTSSGVSGTADCSGIAWDVLFYNELYLTLGSSKYSLGEWQGPSLASGCLGGAPNTNCSNQGLSYAYFYNVEGGNADGFYADFDPTVFYTATPEFIGVEGNAGSFSVDGTTPWVPPGTSGSFPSTEFVLQYRGYLYAKMTGTYTITISNVDDIVLVWLGSAAYSGYTRGDANIAYSIQDGLDGRSGNVYSQNLIQGQYYPFRLMYANGDGPGSFDVSVTAPDGTVVLGGDTGTNPYLVQFSCDETTAPPYAAWGMEQ